MDDYIERKKVIARFTFEQGDHIPEKLIDGYDNVIAVRTIKRVLREIPAADVVPVVRCRDCKHKGKTGKNIIFCENFERDMMPDDFCSCGER